MFEIAVIYFILITFQRITHSFFYDFPNISILMQQILGVFLPVFINYKFIKKEKYIEKKDFEIKIKDIPILFSAGFCMQVFGSFINYPVILYLSKMGITPPAMEPVPKDEKIFIYIILICILPALFEEVLFRKLTFSVLSDYGRKKALFLTALFFAVIHFNPFSFVPLFLAGITMTYTVYKGYPLIYAILFHFSLNFSGIILDFLTKNETMRLFINNYFVFFGVLSMIFTAMFYIYISRERNKNE